MFRSLVANDNTVKAIFDHFRNVGISAAVAAAAIWAYDNPASGWLRYMSYVSTASLTVLSVFLFTLNGWHGHRKMADANVPIFVDLAVRVVYGASVFMLFSAVVGRT